MIPLWKKGAGGFLRDASPKIPLNLTLKKGEVHEKSLNLVPLVYVPSAKALKKR